jgi:hypothetical protein
MTKEEALKLLETAPQSETKPAAINKVLSQKQAVDLIKAEVVLKNARRLWWRAQLRRRRKADIANYE